MHDLSASSGVWWAGVINLVREAYSKWLSATPLERLQLEPTGHEVWTTAKWTRVNSRACSLIDKLSGSHQTRPHRSTCCSKCPSHTLQVAHMLSTGRCSRARSGVGEFAKPHSAHVPGRCSCLAQVMATLGSTVPRSQYDGARRDDIS